VLIKRIAAALILLSFVTGCASSGNDAADATPKPSIDPEKVSKSVPSHLKVEVEGAVDFTYDDDTDLRIVTIDEPGLEQVRFLSVGIETFKKIAGGERFRIAFDLVGVYEGPGSYELPKVGGKEETVEPGSDAEGAAKTLASDLSKPILIYYELKEGESSPGPDSVKRAHQFENAQEPCALKVRREARSGSLSCPEVADAEGKTVSIEMSWRPKR
jgi:hypothetical protein